jgi:hypothetical protein
MNKQQAIDNIMDNFDFRKVWKMMQCNKNFWIHHAVDNCESILREHCRDTLSKSIPREEGVSITTGGFKYTYEVEGDSHFMSLEFIGERFDNYY